MEGFFLFFFVIFFRLFWRCFNLRERVGSRDKTGWSEQGEREKERGEKRALSPDRYYMKKVDPVSVHYFVVHRASFSNSLSFLFKIFFSISVSAQNVFFSDLLSSSLLVVRPEFGIYSSRTASINQKKGKIRKSNSSKHTH